MKKTFLLICGIPSQGKSADDLSPRLNRLVARFVDECVSEYIDLGLTLEDAMTMPEAAGECGLLFAVEKSVDVPTIIGEMISIWRRILSADDG